MQPGYRHVPGILPLGALALGLLLRLAR